MKHRDKWDDYVDKHRDAFEEEVPDVEGLWAGINDGLETSQAPAEKTRNPLRYWVAATMLLGAFCIGLLVDRFAGAGQEETVALLGVEDAEVNDFAATTVQFVRLIEQRKTAMATYEGMEAVPLESFYVDLGQLAAQYDRLSLKLKDTQDPSVLRAMIFNLQLQLDLLNQQLDILESIAPHDQPLEEI